MSQTPAQELEDAKTAYATTNRELAAAKRQGNKTQVRALTRQKARISNRMDALKSQVQKGSYDY